MICRASLCRIYIPTNTSHLSSQHATATSPCPHPPTLSYALTFLLKAHFLASYRPTAPLISYGPLASHKLPSYISNNRSIANPKSSSLPCKTASNTSSSSAGNICCNVCTLAERVCACACDWACVSNDASSVCCSSSAGPSCIGVALFVSSKVRLSEAGKAG